jgi:hypothetical protein
MGQIDGPYSSHNQRLRFTLGLELREFLTHLTLILLKSELANIHIVGSGATRALTQSDAGHDPRALWGR